MSWDERQSYTEGKYGSSMNAFLQVVVKIWKKNLNECDLIGNVNTDDRDNYNSAVKLIIFNDQIHLLIINYCKAKFYSLWIDVGPSNTASIDADCLVGGGKPEQFSAFGREVPCETTAPGRGI